MIILPEELDATIMGYESAVASLKEFPVGVGDTHLAVEAILVEGSVQMGQATSHL